jgi:large subunit ribosomal protein L15
VSVYPSAFNSPSLSIAVQRRGLSAGDSPQDDSALTETERPRWSYTPPAAKAPFSLHLDSKRPDFLVNEDPATLDRFYIRILGTNGDKLLSDEIKWLAITHKSFDQGRRGFNDRLAFLGMSKEHPVHTEGVSTHFF